MLKSNQIGVLILLIENCIQEFDALKRVNMELNKGMQLSSDADVGHLGILNRCVQGYLIIKTASLFDTDSRSVSFYKAIGNEVDKIKKGTILDEIVYVRNKFVAHNDFKYLGDGNFGLLTSKIIDSNLKELLEECKSLLKIDV